MDNRNSFVGQENINVEWIERTFENAFMRVVERHENTVWIKGKRLTVAANLATDKSAIFLAIAAPILPEVDIIRASIAANNCNVRFAWARFWIRHTSDPKVSYLQIDSTLLYERGFVPYHLIRTFDLLEIVALKAIEEEFSSLLV